MKNIESINAGIPQALIGHVTIDESTSCNGAFGSDYEPLDMNPVEWGGVWNAVAYINGYASRTYPKKSLTDEADPLNVAFSLISSIYDWLIKNDPDHASPRHVNTVFMRCRLFDKLYGKINGLHHKKYPDAATGGWNEEQASRKIAAVIKEYEEKAERKQKGIKSKGEQELIDEEIRAAERRRAAAFALKPEKFHAPMTLKDYANIIADHSDLYILRVVRDKKDKPHPSVDLDVFRTLWSEFAQITEIQDVKGQGCVWFNGVEWPTDGEGKDVKGNIDICINSAVKGRAKELAKKYGLTQQVVVEMFRDALRRNTTPHDIAGYRLKGKVSVSLAQTSNQGAAFTDGVVLLDKDGEIRIQKHDPDKDVWFGCMPVSTKVILPNLTKMTLEELTDKFPNLKKALLECGEDKLRLMVSMAGVIFYYMMPREVYSLDIWYHFWDDDIAGTGKSTLMRKFGQAFGSYIAMNATWDQFTGKAVENKRFSGVVSVVCDETTVSKYLDDAIAIKSFTSGSWTLKGLYANTVSTGQPLLMISCGNSKPLLKRAANSQAVFDRLQPCEFTVKQRRRSGHPFPCSDEESTAGFINYGLWQASILMKKGKYAGIDDLVFHPDIEEIQGLCTHVPWQDYMHDIGEYTSGYEESLSDVLTALRDHLATTGWSDDDLRGAPELKSKESFRKVMNGLPMPIFNNYNNVVEKKPLKVVEKNSQKSIQYQTDKYWVKNIKLKNIRAGESGTGKKPQRVLPAGNPDGSRFVNGNIYGNTETGVITHILPCGEDVMNWDVSKFIGKEDPVKIVKKSPLTGKPLYFKPVTFVLSGSTLTDIIPLSCNLYPET